MFEENIKLSKNNFLFFSEQIVHPEPAIYKLKDLYQIFIEQSKELDNKLLYSIYHGIFYKEHQEIFNDINIIYDLTLVYPGKIGNEYIKTKGHFHTNKPNSIETYPEYYEVLQGEALFILQKNSRSGEVEEIIAIEAKINDKIYIPEGFGHIIVNPGNDILILGSLRESTSKYITNPFTAKKGAAYYYIETETGKGSFIKNENYHNSVGLQIMAAPNIDSPIELIENKSIYENFILQPEKFDILK